MIQGLVPTHRTPPGSTPFYRLPWGGWVQLVTKCPTENTFSFYHGMDREVFDLEGAAQYLGPAFNRRWLRENCVALGIAHVRLKNRFRFTKTELDRFLSQYLGKGKKGVYAA
jgi:hypothetical protein